MQKKAIRTITQSKYNDHTAALFYDEKILPLDYVILQAKLIFMHSIKYKYCPHSFNDVFTYNNVEDFVYELRYPNEFIVPRARIELFKKIPLYTFFFLPEEWNNCHDLRFYQNTATFKIVFFETMFKIFAEKSNLIGELP
jgi:hypothetical protein